MPKRASKWTIHERKNGNWDLSKGGRYMYEGLGSKPEVLQRLKNHHRPGEPVVHEEPDGYKTNVTVQLKKARVIT